MHNHKKQLLLIILTNIFLSTATTIEAIRSYERKRLLPSRTQYQSTRQNPYRSSPQARIKRCAPRRICATRSTCNKQEIWPEWFPMEQRMINGRMYTKHALERMAPDIPPVRLELERRALALEYPYGSAAFTNYIIPRGISPKTVERVIKKGKSTAGTKAMTKQYQYHGIRVITNQDGTVITVIRLT